VIKSWEKPIKPIRKNTQRIPKSSIKLTSSITPFKKISEKTAGQLKRSR
jgi:hypothetical protein